MDASLGRKVALDSKVVLQRVAQRTLRFDFSVWFWGDAIAFDGLLDAAELLSDRTYSRFCERFLNAGKSGRRPGLIILPRARTHAVGWRRTQIGLSDLAKRLLDHYLVRHHAARQDCIISALTCRSFGPRCWSTSLYHVPPFIAACAQIRMMIRAYCRGARDVA